MQSSSPPSSPGSPSANFDGFGLHYPPQLTSSPGTKPSPLFVKDLINPRTASSGAPRRSLFDRGDVADLDFESFASPTKRKSKETESPAKRMKALAPRVLGPVAHAPDIEEYTLPSIHSEVRTQRVHSQKKSPQILLGQLSIAGSLISLDADKLLRGTFHRVYSIQSNKELQTALVNNANALTQNIQQQTDALEKLQKIQEACKSALELVNDQSSIDFFFSTFSEALGPFRIDHNVLKGDLGLAYPIQSKEALKKALNRNLNDIATRIEKTSHESNRLQNGLKLCQSALQYITDHPSTEFILKIFIGDLGPDQIERALKEDLAGYKALLEAGIPVSHALIKPDDFVDSSSSANGNFWILVKLNQSINQKGWDSASKIEDLSKESLAILSWAREYFTQSAIEQREIIFDFRPRNTMLDAKDNPCIVDFGVPTTDKGEWELHIISYLKDWSKGNPVILDFLMKGFPEEVRDHLARRLTDPHYHEFLNPFLNASADFDSDCEEPSKDFGILEGFESFDEPLQ